MGRLVDGTWSDTWYETEEHGGRFVRPDAQVRRQVTRSGGEFPAAVGRYHLYVSHACPWAHRSLIVRSLKKLDAAISVSVVHPLMLEHGWEFRESFAGATPDHLHGRGLLHQVYTAHDPRYSGRVTVPVLWDKQTDQMVNNESEEIIRMFNEAFDELPGVNSGLDLYPPALREAIGEVNARVYRTVNNGVYRCGFATSQAAYEEAFTELFDALDWLEERLAVTRFLVGGQLTEADIRLFTTLIRFDAVYVGHFKCNRRRIADYPALSGFVRDIYQWPGVRETVFFDHIKTHYYASHRGINPTGIVPAGPELDLLSPPNRPAQ